MQKVYRLIRLSIDPATKAIDENGQPYDVPAYLYHTYQIQIEDNGKVVAEAVMHDGSVPLDGSDQAVPIAPDGTTKKISEMFAESGAKFPITNETDA